MAHQKLGGGVLEW